MNLVSSEREIVYYLHQLIHFSARKGDTTTKEQSFHHANQRPSFLQGHQAHMEMPPMKQRLYGYAAFPNFSNFSFEKDAPLK